MYGRLVAARARFRSNLTGEQQLGLCVIGWVGAACLVGVAVTGVWQFVTHEPEPSWFRYDPSTEFRRQSPDSEGMGAAHGFFATASAIVALFGGAWFSYRVAFDVSKSAVAVLLVTVSGLFTGSMIRFNAVKLEGRSLADAGEGYAQLFTNRVEFVVTDRADLGATGIRLLTAVHVLTVPVLLAIVWFAATRPSADGAHR